MKNIIDLTGKKILVTGASSGIGRSTSILLSQIGASVVLVSRNEAQLTETLKHMDDNGNHKCIASDLSQMEKLPILMKEAFSYDNIKLDGLVHCAGIGIGSPLMSLSMGIIDKIMNINYFSFLILTREFIKKQYNNGGSIVGISSIGAHKSQKCLSVYAGSKMALEGAVSTLSLELTPKNIRINTVVAGATDTPMMRNVGDINNYINSLVNLYPLAKPIDISYAIAFLLSEASSTITGKHYYVNGGFLQ